MALPRVGQSLAERIQAARPLSNRGDLLAVRGISEALVSQWGERIRFD